MGNSFSTMTSINATVTAINELDFSVAPMTIRTTGSTG